MTPTEAIRERLLQKREEYEDYKRHLAMRTTEEDLHGMWDCSINMAEVASAIDALEFALKVVEEEKPAEASDWVPKGIVLPGCSCEPYFAGRNDGHKSDCRKIVAASSGAYPGVRMLRTPYGCEVVWSI